MRFIKEGWIFIAPLILIDIWWHSFTYQFIKNLIHHIFLVTLPSSILLLILISFFRDPHRIPSPNYSPKVSILSPADGTISSITKENGNFTIFIDIHYYNVHVTRAHLPGKIISINQIPGKHRLIYFLIQNKVKTKKSLVKNAQVVIQLIDREGKIFEFCLICGGVFRRAFPYVRVGDTIEKGQKMGVILFGSNVKVSLPGINYRFLVKKGEKVKAGHTIICELKESELM